MFCSLGPFDLNSHTKSSTLSGTNEPKHSLSTLSISSNITKNDYFHQRDGLKQSAKNRRLCLRHAMILISNVRTSASKKINQIALIRTLTVSITAFERMKDKFYVFRQTENSACHCRLQEASQNQLVHELTNCPGGNT